MKWVLNTTIYFFCTEVRWLSRGKVLRRVYELRKEINEFLKRQEKESLFDEMEFVSKLAYLTDIFEHFNKLNLSLQNNNDILDVSDRIRGFIEKLIVWKKRINNNVFEMFELFGKHLKENDLSFAKYKDSIFDHLSNLKNYFDKYFKEILENNNLRWIRNPFLADSETQSLTIELQNELIELKCNEYFKMKYQNLKLTSFWIEVKSQFPTLAEIAINHLLPFPSTYLCESAFSSLTYLKNKYRSKLQVECDLRLSLTQIKPNIDFLCNNKQLHSF